MTNENLQSNSEQKRIPFGTRLKSAREALGLERKDVASQLRLNEKIIVMMEKDRYPADLPITFIRGYLRSYAKFLQIPDYEIKKGIEPIKPKMTSTVDIAMPAPPTDDVTTGNYFIQFITYLVIFTLVGLAAIWWYTHTGHRARPTGDSVEALKQTKFNQPQPITKPVSPSATENLSSDDQFPSDNSEEATDLNVEQVAPQHESLAAQKPAPTTAGTSVKPISVPAVNSNPVSTPAGTATTDNSQTLQTTQPYQQNKRLSQQTE